MTPLKNIHHVTAKVCFKVASFLLLSIKVLMNSRKLKRKTVPLHETAYRARKFHPHSNLSLVSRDN
jgi:hypothetical protein